MPRPSELTVLTVLLPVHNRGLLTASFVLHLYELLPVGMNLKVVVFNDGCTDDTVTNVKSVWPSVEVVSLDGKAFWGGAINAISNYIKERPFSEESIYLLANDDIRFASKSAFCAGLREVDQGAMICATEFRVQSLEAINYPFLKKNLFEAIRVHFNSKTGNFEKATFEKPVNVSSTYAMLTTKDAWLIAPPVPRTIPHYLSDYWFTYQLVLLGYKIVHPDDFICFESALTSRRSNEPIGDKRHWLRAKVDYLQSSLNKPSPSYIPAWIEFLSQKPIYPSVRIKILKLKLHLLLGSFLYSRKIRS